MKYSAVTILAAAVAGAQAYGKNVTVVTEVVDKYVTYCPEPTEIPIGDDKTITVTEPGTITITDCPCTVTKPVVEETHEVCYDCPEKPEDKPEEPEKPEEPPVEETPIVEVPPPTGGVTPTGEPEPVPTAGAGKAAALSGAGLAGVVGLAAFVL